MKRILLNVAFTISIAAAVVSFWAITLPVPVLAASASADCRDGSTIECKADGGSCFASDPTSEHGRYCFCTVNGQQTVFKSCPADPPLID